MKTLICIIQFLLIIVLKPLLIFFTHLKVKGLENLDGVDQSRGVILASNHNSQFDSFFIPISMPLIHPLKPIRFVSAPRGYYDHFTLGALFYGGVIFSILGAVPLRKRQRDYAKALMRPLGVIKSGATMIIYPEAYRQKEPGFGEVHGGLGYLAKESGATIIPVYIEGNKNSNWTELFTRARHVSVTFGKPISLAKVNNTEAKNPYKQTAKNIFKNIQNLKS